MADMTLPTRKKLRYWREDKSSLQWNTRDDETIRNAYADGVLMTREEWLATIDYKAAVSALIDAEFRRFTELGKVKAVVDAALGDNE